MSNESLIDYITFGKIFQYKKVPFTETFEEFTFNVKRGIHKELPKGSEERFRQGQIYARWSAYSGTCAE